MTTGFLRAANRGHQRTRSRATTGKLGARLIGKVVDPEKQVEEALMQEMETAFKEFGIEAKISSVANAQTIGTGLLELPIQVRSTKEVHHDD